MHSTDHSLSSTCFRVIGLIVRVSAIAIAIAIAIAACFSMPQKNPHPDRLPLRI
jgi:hypothetical protein